MQILAEAPGEVPGLLTSKLGIKHTGPHLDAMAAIARSAKSRSLEAFQEAVRLMHVRTQMGVPVMQSIYAEHHEFTFLYFRS